MTVTDPGVSLWTKQAHQDLYGFLPSEGNKKSAAEIIIANHIRVTRWIGLWMSAMDDNKESQKKNIWVLDDTVGPVLSLDFLLWVNNIPFCLKILEVGKGHCKLRPWTKAKKLWAKEGSTVLSCYQCDRSRVATLRSSKAKVEASTQSTQGSSRQTWSTSALTSVTKPIVLESIPCLSIAGSPNPAPPLQVCKLWLDLYQAPIGGSGRREGLGKRV